jgi:hypothetical protein
MQALSMTAGQSLPGPANIIGFLYSPSPAAAAPGGETAVLKDTAGNVLAVIKATTAAVPVIFPTPLNSPNGLVCSQLPAGGTCVAYLV